MGSIILELQKELISENCNVLTALRKAHLIAAKLGLVDFDNWILCELNGYSSDDLVPEYRLVQGTVRAFNPHHGWIPTGFDNDEIEKILSERKIAASIGEIVELCKNSTGYVTITYPSSIIQKLNRCADTPVSMEIALHVGIPMLTSVVEKVKTCLLEWTLSLEKKGILGEDVTFNSNESAQAQTIPQQTNYYYGNVVQGNVSNSQIVSGNKNQVEFEYETATELLYEIRESLKKESGTLATLNIQEAEELLDDLNAKIERKRTPAIIKSVLVGLKDFLINAGAGVTAAIIEAKMTGLF